MVHLSRLIIIIVLTAIVAGLAGCSQSSAGLYDDYMGRLANVMAVPKPEWSLPPLVSPPRNRDLVVAIPDLKVTPLSYWNLRHCALFNLISERNSILGRVATPTNVWRYEARVLQGIESCLDHPETDAEQAEQLQAWRSEKQTSWPAATWNGTLAAPSMRQLWRPSIDGWAPGQIPSITSLSNDLATLSSWVHAWSEPSADRPVTVDSSQFNAVYQRLDQHNVGGEWRRSVRISISGLEAATQQVTQAIAEDTLCPAGRRTRAADNAQNVLQLVFIGDIQPYIAELNRRGETLLADLADLAAAIDLVHPEWDAFFAGLQADLDQLQASSRQHAQQWQILLDRCAITPGG